MTVVCQTCHNTISPSKNKYSCAYCNVGPFHSSKCLGAHIKDHHPEEIPALIAANKAWEKLLK